MIVANALLFLLPLFIGYLTPFQHPMLLTIVNRLLSWLVLIILFFMGITLALLDNLHSNLFTISCYTLVFAFSIISCNVLSLKLLEKFRRWPSPYQDKTVPVRLERVVESMKLAGMVVCGFLAGLTQWPPLHYSAQGSHYALILLLLLVGLQLRNSSINLKQIVLNRQGILTAVVVAFSALIGGMIAAGLLKLPLAIGLAISSGFGWYSLSGIMLTEAYGSIIGSTAFLNDLLRELLAISLMPMLIRQHRTLALGLCGATSIDFTLPMLQRSGGHDIVPAAIVHGFALSILAPVLITLFSS